MTSPIPEYALELAKDRMEQSKKHSQRCETVAAKETDGKNTIIQLNEAIIYTFLESAYPMCEVTMRAVNNLYDALDKLPKREEFDEVKDILATHESKIRQTLEPLKKEYDEYKEREAKGEDVYG